MEYAESTYKRRNNGLVMACEAGDLERVKYHLTNPRLKVRASVEDRGARAITRACRHGHTEVLAFLLEQRKTDLSLNAKASLQGGLLVACTYGHLDIVVFILNLELMRNDTLNFYIRNCFSAAALHGRLNVMKELTTNPLTKRLINFEKLYLTYTDSAMASGKLDVLKYIMEYPGVVNLPDYSENNFKLLERALIFGNFEVLEYLLLNHKLRPTPEDLDKFEVCSKVKDRILPLLQSLKLKEELESTLTQTQEPKTKRMKI